MTWVAWRQCRLELIMGLALLGALAAFLVPTGVEKLALFRDSGLAACLGTPTAQCFDLARRFRDSYSTLNGIVMWFVLVPAIIGVLLAAPIVMEFEQRTYRLAWTQSLTRGRWLATKLAMALLGAAVLALALTALMTWWYAPLNRVQDPFATSFYLGGAMPLTYTVFAMALTLALGAVSRRVVLAMLVTVVVFFVAQMAIGIGLRQNYLPPMERIVESSIQSDPRLSSNLRANREWVLDSYSIDWAGNRLTDAQLSELDEKCAVVEKQDIGKQDIASCLESHGVRGVERYHPADRFWTFQAIEAAIYLGMAAPLLGLTVWVVRRRMR